MKYEHRAIIENAARKNMSPMELAAELMGHDLLKSMVTAIGGHAVPFQKMSEQQQDAVIHTMQEDMKQAIDTAVRTISSAGTRTVRMKLKKATIGKRWQFTGEVDTTEDYLHELGDKAQDQIDVLVILYENDYLQGLDAIKGESDQKDLELGEEPAEKPARKGSSKKAGDIANSLAEAKPKPELPVGLIDQAEEFVRKFQTVTHAGIQNHLKIDFGKADALMDALEARGVVTAQDESGNRELVRAKPEPVIEPVAPQDQGQTPSEITPALYAKAKSKVIQDQRVSSGALAIFYDLDDELATTLLGMLEDDGVISEESEMGTREVLVAEAVDA